MSHGSDLSATRHAASAPRDPKTKSAHLKMALWMRVSPWGSFPISFSQTCKIFPPELQCMLIAVVYLLIVVFI